jgi:hypothetical protein
MIKTFVGMGYILSDTERVRLLAPVAERSEAYNVIMDEFHALDPEGGVWFFGEVLTDIPCGTAKSIETISVLPGLIDPNEFGLKFGMLLSLCDISIEEINNEWGNPNVYICCQEVC